LRSSAPKATRESSVKDFFKLSFENCLLEIKEEYQKEFGRDLEKDVKGDTSGDFKKFMVAMLQVCCAFQPFRISERERGKRTSSWIEQQRNEMRIC
jgi:hypothetical protein